MVTPTCGPFAPPEHPWTVINDDVLHWAETYTGPKLDGLLSDAPYHLLSIVKRFGKEGSAPAKGKGALQRLTRGFQNQTWDGVQENGLGIAFDPETWRKICRHLKPGAFGMVCASSRGWHRLACAIEDAGMILHPSVFLYAFSSGFPKATNIHAQIDRAAGVKPTIARERGPGNVQVKRATSKEAQAWEGHRYGLQALKPAVEVIICFQVPYETVTSDQLHDATGWDHWHRDMTIDAYTPAFRLKVLKKYGLRLPSGYEDVVVTEHKRLALHAGVRSEHYFMIEPARQWRKQPTAPVVHHVSSSAYRTWTDDGGMPNLLVNHTGAINVEAGKIGKGEDRSSGGTSGKHEPDGVYDRAGLNQERERPVGGRWPAQFQIEHSANCVYKGSYVREAAYHLSRQTDGAHPFGNAAGSEYEGEEINERVDVWDCVEQCPAHRLDLQSGSRREGLAFSSMAQDDDGGAARFFFQSSWALDIEEQLALADTVVLSSKAQIAEREAGLHDFEPQTTGDGRKKEIQNPYLRIRQRKNMHPTAKPITWAEHMAKLLLPPGEYSPQRRLLVPFSGVGSEMIGGMLAGWDQVIGIEITPSYVPIAEARLRWWEARMQDRRTHEPTREFIRRVVSEKPVTQAATEQLSFVFD